MASGGDTESAPAGSPGLFAISCPSVTTCYVPAQSASAAYLLATTNAGVTWDETSLGFSNPEKVITCPTVSSCYLAGYSPTGGSDIGYTSDGGDNLDKSVPPIDGERYLGSFMSIDECMLRGWYRGQQIPVP